MYLLVFNTHTLVLYQIISSLVFEGLDLVTCLRLVQVFLI